MSDELREMLFSELIPGLLAVVAAIVGGYLGRQGWKGWIARRILNGIIEGVVDALNQSLVPRLKAETQTDKPEKGYDLTPLQARAVMHEAKNRVMEQAKEQGIDKVVPPTAVLQEKIEQVVQRKKLDGPQRLGKGR